MIKLVNSPIEFSYLSSIAKQTYLIHIWKQSKKKEEKESS